MIYERLAIIHLYGYINIYNHLLALLVLLRGPTLLWAPHVI